jgi:hypothetical protein
MYPLFAIQFLFPLFLVIHTDHSEAARRARVGDDRAAIYMPLSGLALSFPIIQLCLAPFTAS